MNNSSNLQYNRNKIEATSTDTHGYDGILNSDRIAHLAARTGTGLAEGHATRDVCCAVPQRIHVMSARGARASVKKFGACRAPHAGPTRQHLISNPAHTSSSPQQQAINFRDPRFVSLPTLPLYQRRCSPAPPAPKPRNPWGTGHACSLPLIFLGRRSARRLRAAVPGSWWFLPPLLVWVGGGLASSSLESTCLLRLRSRWRCVILFRRRILCSC